jgi:hypothetical protein
MPPSYQRIASFESGAVDDPANWQVGLTLPGGSTTTMSADTNNFAHGSQGGRLSNSFNPRLGIASTMYVSLLASPIDISPFGGIVIPADDVAPNIGLSVVVTKYADVSPSWATGGGNNRIHLALENQETLGVAFAFGVSVANMTVGQTKKLTGPLVVAPSIQEGTYNSIYRITISAGELVETGSIDLTFDDVKLVRWLPASTGGGSWSDEPTAGGGWAAVSKAPSGWS